MIPSQITEKGKSSSGQIQLHDSLERVFQNNHRNCIFRCTECPFETRSIYRLCRHLLLTLHSLVKCPLCDTFVVSNMFYDALTKWLRNLQQLKINLLVHHIDSEEKHPHSIPNRVVELHDFYLRSISHQPQSHHTQASSGEHKFHCLECLNEFDNWTALSKHCNISDHISSTCAECGQVLKCFGPTTPERHADSLGHFAFFGVFYTRNDYQVDSPPFLSRDQYRCVCGQNFLSTVYIARHLREDHGVRSIPDRATCEECHESGTLGEMIVHQMDHWEDGADGRFVIDGFQASRYLVPRPTIIPRGCVTLPIILLQCQTCCKIFSGESMFLQHQVRSRHNLLEYRNCFCMRPLSVTRVAGSQSDPLLFGAHATGHERVGRHSPTSHYEVFVDLNNDKMKSLIDRPETEGNVIVGYQCPIETCTAAFLAHGELMDHMEQSSHIPQAGNVPGTVEHLKNTIHTYRSTFTADKLIRWFNFSMCDRCGSLVRPGEKDDHLTICISILGP